MLSIVITVYNGAETLTVQLEALAKQHCHEPWEIVLVDNASSDDSAAIARSFLPRIPNLRIVDEFKLRGRAHALNTGIQAARGHSILTTDQDDEVGEGWLPAMATALQEHEFVASQMDHTRLNPPWLHWKQQVTTLPQLWFPPHIPYAAGTSTGFHRSVYERVGPFDPTLRFLQDTDFEIRAHLLGIPVQFAPEAVLHYRRRTELKDHYEQARNYSRECTILARRYMHTARETHGAPKLLRLYKSFVRTWAKLALEAPRRRTPPQHYDYVWRLGRQVGRLQGVLFDRGIPV